MKVTAYLFFHFLSFIKPLSSENVSMHSTTASSWLFGLWSSNFSSSRFLRMPSSIVATLKSFEPISFYFC